MTTEIQFNPLCSVSDAAGRLGVSTARVYSMIRDGILPLGVAVRQGRALRINPDALAMWISGGGQALPGGWRRTPPSAEEQQQKRR